MKRPLIAIPARFSESASALRYRAEVTARAVAESVYDAGGEPLAMHPASGSSDAEAGARLSFADGILLPGGGDLDPRWAGQEPDPAQYDVDAEQDAFDLAVARVALSSGAPLLAICRGTQVVNVALGGDLVQDMATAAPGSGEDHRHRKHDVDLDPGSLVAAVVGGTRLPVSCYHHQCLGRLGSQLRVAARAGDGTIEAVELPGRRAWFLGVQWHPEDLADSDAENRALFEAFVRAAGDRS